MDIFGNFNDRTKPIEENTPKELDDRKFKSKTTHKQTLTFVKLLRDKLITRFYIVLDKQTNEVILANYKVNDNNEVVGIVDYLTVESMMKFLNSRSLAKVEQLIYETAKRFEKQHKSELENNQLYKDYISLKELSRGHRNNGFDMITPRLATQIDSWLHHLTARNFINAKSWEEEIVQGTDNVTLKDILTTDSLLAKQGVRMTSYLTKMEEKDGKLKVFTMHAFEVNEIGSDIKRTFSIEAIGYGDVETNKVDLVETGVLNLPRHHHKDVPNLIGWVNVPAKGLRPNG